MIIIDGVRINVERMGDAAVLQMETVVGVKARFTRQEWRQFVSECSKVEQTWPVERVMPDYYAVLGISKTATAAQIRAAFRKLARMHHPDLHTGDHQKKQSEEKFKEINEAYETLSDPEKRRQYDGP